MFNQLFRIRGLHKRFPNGFEALRGIDLDIADGEFLVIAGANGSGKTVLMRCLVGLLKPSAGTILFRGQNLASLASRLNRSVGLVFQDADAQFVGETVAEDVAFGPNNLGLSAAEVESRTLAALEAVKLTDKSHQPTRRLSGGEKRKLAIAGILAMGGEAIILDEPFANLDWPGVVLVLQALQELKRQGITVVVLTHELEKILAHADRLAILSQGQLLDNGQPTQVLNRLVAAWGVRDPRHCYKTVADCTWTN